MKFAYVSLIIALVFCGKATAQKYSLDYHWDTQISESILSEHLKKTTFKDSLSLVKYLSDEKLSLLNKGFLEISIDSLVCSTYRHCKAYIHLGNRCKYLNIRYNVKYKPLLRDIKSKYLNQSKISALDINKENRRIVKYLQNNAYPFAEVKLDSLDFRNDTLSAFLDIHRGTRLNFNKVELQGSLKLTNSFLYGFTGIKPKKKYEQSKLDELPKLLNSLPFVRTSLPPDIQLDSNTVDVKINADKKKGNRFDGILAVVPNDKTSGKTLITGELNIFVQNIFRNGESMKFNWKKLQASSQDLDIQTKVPYIAGTPLGVDASLNLHKQDTSYLNANSQISVLYFFKGSNYIGVRYAYKNSSILGNNSVLLKNYKSTKAGTYGLVFKSQNLDFPWNPMKGYELELASSLGNKQEKGNSEPIFQSEVSLLAKLYVPIFKQSTLLIMNRTASLISESIYNNELYRIGGLNTLRGFSESSIYASSYSILNLEYRFVFESKSALFMFFNGAWIEKNQQTYFQDFPFGFGLGMFFSTKAGIFTISYALGKQKNEDIQLKNGKIHFGIVSRF